MDSSPRPSHFEFPLLSLYVMEETCIAGQNRPLAPFRLNQRCSAFLERKKKQKEKCTAFIGSTLLSVSFSQWPIAVIPIIRTVMIHPNDSS